MRLSEKLFEAIISEALFDSGDALKSLNSLIKRNDGEWKSEAQAKFLLKQLKANYQTKEAVAWAQKQGLYHKGAIAIEVTKRIEGFGYKDPSKVRIMANVFVLDGSGVIARAKFKFKHFKKATQTAEGIDWGTGKITFQRKEEPSKKYVDIEKEEADELRKEKERKAEARKQMDLIKKIPGWEDKNIFLDFMDRLIGGWPLTPNQLAVVKENLPVAIGDKDNWKKNFESFKKLIAEKLAVPLKEMEAYSLKKEIEKYQSVSPEIRKRDFHSEPYVKGVDDIKEFIKEMKSQGYSSGGWVDSHIFDFLSDLVYGSGRQRIRSDAWTFEDIYDQYKKAIKAKKPTKKAIRVMTYIARAVDKLEKLNKQKVFMMFADRHKYEIPPEEPEEPKVVEPQKPKKNIGFKIPSPKQFGF